MGYPPKNSCLYKIPSESSKMSIFKMQILFQVVWHGMRVISYAANRQHARPSLIVGS